MLSERHAVADTNSTGRAGGIGQLALLGKEYVREIVHESTFPTRSA